MTAAGGASGNPVTFTVDPSSTSVCSIAGAVVSFLAVGTCTIDANQAGGPGYSPAGQIQQVIAVGGRQQTETGVRLNSGLPPSWPFALCNGSSAVLQSFNLRSNDSIQQRS